MSSLSTLNPKDDDSSDPGYPSFKSNSEARAKVLIQYWVSVQCRPKKSEGDRFRFGVGKDS